MRKRPVSQGQASNHVGLEAASVPSKSKFFMVTHNHYDPRAYRCLVEEVDRGTGLLHASLGSVGRHQVAQVYGHRFGDGGECRASLGVGPGLAAPPSGGVGPAGVACLGVPETGGNCLDRLAIRTVKFQCAAELRNRGQVGGPRDSGKTRDRVILSRV